MFPHLNQSFIEGKKHKPPAARCVEGKQTGNIKTVEVGR